MVVVALGRFQIPRNVVKCVRGCGRSIKAVKRSVSVQGAIIALRANYAKQRVGYEAKRIQSNLVRK